MLKIPSKKPSKGTWIIVLLGLVTLVFLSMIVVKVVGLFEGKQTNSVFISMARTGDMTSTIAAYGRLNTRGTTTQIAKINGTIAQIYAFPGEYVKKGNAVIKMVNPAVERALDMASLEVLSAKANSEGVHAQLAREEMELLSQIQVLKTGTTYSQKEFDTMGVLLVKGLVSSLEHLRAETKLEQLKQEHHLAKRKYEAFQIYKSSQLNAAEYQIQASLKRESLAREDYENLTIFAESNGLLNEFKSNYQKGDPINQGTVLFEVSDPTNVYATLMVSASQAEFLDIDQPVTINLRQQTYRGLVSRVYPKVENNQVTLEVDLIEPIKAENISNIEVVGEVTIGAVSNTVILNTPSSLDKSAKTATLYVKEGNTFYRREVSLGLINDREIEILKGVKPGQFVAFNVPKSLEQNTTIDVGELPSG